MSPHSCQLCSIGLPDNAGPFCANCKSLTSVDGLPPEEVIMVRPLEGHSWQSRHGLTYLVNRTKEPIALPLRAQAPAKKPLAKKSRCRRCNHKWGTLSKDGLCYSCEKKIQSLVKDAREKSVDRMRQKLEKYEEEDWESMRRMREPLGQGLVGVGEPQRANQKAKHDEALHERIRALAEPQRGPVPPPAAPPPCEHEWRWNRWMLLHLFPPFGLLSLVFSLWTGAWPLTHKCRLCGKDGCWPKKKEIGLFSYQIELINRMKLAAKQRRRQKIWRFLTSPYRLIRWFVRKPLAWIRYKRKLREFDRLATAEDQWRLLYESRVDQ